MSAIQLDLYGEPPAPTALHMLMPDMLTACRRCTLWDCADCPERIDHTSPRGWVMTVAETTCPDCLAVDIPAEIARMTGRQVAA